jgi:succinate--hydroxymethylglutarate CoA-transferase
MLWLKRTYPDVNSASLLTDSTCSSEMGLMHITGERGGPPVKVGCAVTDLTTGLYASHSILAALYGRAHNGIGQHIDVALSDCQVATLSNMAESVLITGKKDSGRWGTSHRMFPTPRT